jgi:hypothetical protein
VTLQWICSYFVLCCCQRVPKFHYAIKIKLLQATVERRRPGRQAAATLVANSYRWIVYLGILFVSWLDKSIKKSTNFPLSIREYMSLPFWWSTTDFCLGEHNNKPQCFYNGWKRREQPIGWDLIVEKHEVPVRKYSEIPSGYRKDRTSTNFIFLFLYKDRFVHSVC